MQEGRRFVVKSLLGRGGFGAVYLADMVSAGGFRKEVALKVLSGEVAGNHQAEVRLRDEARLLGLLRHRNIVAVDDLVRFDEGWGVVMEYVPGVDLGVYITDLARNREAFPQRAAAEVVRGVARALEAAYDHQRPDGEPLRAIHRDIKPGNIRVTPEGEVKVLDFGIARAEFDAREAVTGDARFGSMAYMSPERVMGDPDGAPGDIYALGIVLYEALARRPRGRAKLREADHAEQVGAMQAGVSVHPELSRLLGDMVAFDPAARPSAAEVGTRLRSFLADLPGPDLETLSRTVVPRVLQQSGPTPLAKAREFVPVTRSLENPSTTTDFESIGLPTTHTTVPSDDDITGGSVAPVPTAASSSPTVSEPVRKPAVSPLSALAGALVVLALGGVGFAVLGPTRTAPAPAPSTALAPAPRPVVSPEAQPAQPKATTPPLPPEQAPPATDAVPPPEPEAAPEAPPEPKPAPPVRSTPKASPAPVPKAAEPIEPDPPEAGPTLRAVKFSVAGAARVSATCGGVSGSGASSALVRQAPAGTCTVRASVGDAEVSGSVRVDEPRLYKCTASAGALQCQ